MKRLVAILALVVLIGCAQNESRAVFATQTTVPALTTDTHAAPVAKVREFDIQAKKWEFVPGNIVVNQGDSVILHVTSADVSHGFALLDYGINEQLPPGETVDIRFVADKKG